MRVPIAAAIAAALFLASFLPPAAIAGEARLGGSIRNYVILSDLPGSDQPGGASAWQALSLIRGKVFYDYSDAIDAEFAYELTPLIREGGGGELGQGAVGRPVQAYRAADLGEALASEDGDPVVMQNLDRAFITIRGKNADLYIGRQAVSFGSAKAVNPLDVIAPYSFGTLAKEELAGVDAVRLKSPSGDRGEADAGIVFGEDMRPVNSAFFLRSRQHIGQTDVTLMTMFFKENVLAGADLARSIGGAGAWLEFAEVFLGPDAEGDDYFRLSTGADYRFTDKIYAYLEYHYSGAGTVDEAEYLDNASGTAFTEGAVYLLGRYYAATSFSYEATALAVISGSALINIADGSALAGLRAEYSLTENSYLYVGTYVGIGPGPASDEEGTLVPRSEFGLYPDLYFASLSYYF